MDNPRLGHTSFALAAFAVAASILTRAPVAAAQEMPNSAPTPPAVPPAASPTAAAPPAATASVTPASPETVAVALRADADHATIERRTSVQSFASFPFHDAALAGIETWQPACVAPCTTRLDPRLSYRVSGQGLVPSTPFTLPQDRDSVVIDAHMGSAYGRVGGLVLTAGGAGALLLGGAALIAAPILEGQNVGTPALRTAVLSGGVGFVGLGIIGIGAGLWLWLHNDTEVRVDPSSRQHASRAAHPSPARLLTALAPSGVAF